MPVDHSLPLRKALVTHLRNATACPAVVALVAARVYGDQPPPTPDWPFIRVGKPQALPYEATGWDGVECPVVVHAFAKGPGEDAISELAKAISDSLDNSALPLEPLALVSIDWQGTETIPDGAEPGAYHAILRFNVKTTEPV